jgi:hypothetical protein
MLADLIPQSKDSVWQTGLKKEDPTSVSYRRPMSLIQISIGLG